MTILYECENGMKLVDSPPPFIPTGESTSWVSGEESGTSVLGTIEGVWYRKTEFDGCEIMRFDIYVKPITPPKITPPKITPPNGCECHWHQPEPFWGYVIGYRSKPWEFIRCKVCK